MMCCRLVGGTFGAAHSGFPASEEIKDYKKGNKDGERTRFMRSYLKSGCSKEKVGHFSQVKTERMTRNDLKLH